MAEIKKLQQQVKKPRRYRSGRSRRQFATATEVNGAKLIVGEMPPGLDEQMRAQIDRIMPASAVVVVGWADDGKVGLLAAVTEDLAQKGVHGGKLIGQVAKVVGGGGGGKPSMAQAGGKDPAKLPEGADLGDSWRRRAGRVSSDRPKGRAETAGRKRPVKRASTANTRTWSFSPVYGLPARRYEQPLGRVNLQAPSSSKSRRQTPSLFPSQPGVPPMV